MTRQRAAIVVLGAFVVAAALLLMLRREGPYDLPRADWRTFRAQFVSAEGRVIDTGNGDISHSEGQGYGMLFAEAYGDRRTFDLLWKWTQTHLQTRPDDKLLSWKWKPDGQDDEAGGRVTDPNNASDGDLLVAWALVRAAKRWSVFDYERSAQQILVDLARLDVVASGGVSHLLPGTDGFRHGEAMVLNPSYYVFRALRELGGVFPGTPWAGLVAAGMDLVREARFGEWRLTPDWVRVDAEGAASLPPGFAPDFGYNAVRIPLYLAWEDPSSPLLEPFAGFWDSFENPDSIPATINLVTGDSGPDPSLPGMRDVARLASALVAGQRLTIKDIAPVGHDVSYYSACLTILVKMAIRETSPAVLPGESS